MREWLPPDLCAVLIEKVNHAILIDKIEVNVVRKIPGLPSDIVDFYGRKYCSWVGGRYTNASSTKYICTHSKQLANGPFEYQGHLQVRLNSTWHKVCVDDMTEAHHVCDSFGWSSYTHKLVSSSRRTVNYDLQCQGGSCEIVDLSSPKQCSKQVQCRAQCTGLTDKKFSSGCGGLMLLENKTCTQKCTYGGQSGEFN